jgi:hypothetical protein
MKTRMMPYWSLCDMSGYTPKNKGNNATFSVISENIRIFASSNKNRKIWHKLKRIVEKKTY